MKVLIVVILVAIAGYAGYRYFSKPKPTETPVPEVQVETDPVPEPSPVVETRTPPAATNRIMTVAKERTVAQAPQPTGDWKLKMDEILNSTAPPETMIRQIKELLSGLPAAEAEQAVQSLTLAVKDESYGFIKSLAVDPNLPEPVRDEFMVDLMNRPNSIKIPLFLELARNPNHPDNENAYETLEAFTGLKLGADWTGWEKGIEQWLKDNPDRARKPRAAAEAN